MIIPLASGAMEPSSLNPSLRIFEKSFPNLVRNSASAPKIMEGNISKTMPLAIMIGTRIMPSAIVSADENIIQV